jgi:hypothetical protein
MEDALSPFPHRLNKDGSFDSICGKCYRTVTTQTAELDLAVYETEHVCTAANLRDSFFEFDAMPFGMKNPAPK